MSNFLMRIKEFFCNDLFLNNCKAAHTRNKKVLRTVIIGSIFAYIMLFVASNVSPAYAGARTSYVIGIGAFLLILLMLRFVSDKSCTTLIYIIHFIFIGYCIRNSAFVWPNDICVMILAEIFILSTLVLDKSWRVTLVTVISGALYIVAISGFKSPYHFLDELVNVVCFTIISCIVGSFTRKTQLENFDSIEKLRISEEHYKLAMKHSNGVICEYDVADKCVIMTKDVSEIFETPQRVYDVPYGPVKKGAIAPESINSYVEFYEGILNGNKTGTAEFECRTEKGWRWQRATYSTIFSDVGKPISAVISFADITERRNMEIEQKKNAEIDGLTGIYNRKTVEAAIKKRLLDFKGDSYAFIIVDLDNLKTINDTFGHPAGDMAIKTLACQLKNILGKNDVLGRIGGDEFIAYFDNIKTEKEISDKMKTFFKYINKVNVGAGHSLGASVGVVLDSDGNTSFDRLYRNADNALYMAKRNGKNQFVFYNN